MGSGAPVDDTAKALVEEGKLCGYCGADIRTDYGLNDNGDPNSPGENMDRGTGTGSVQCCAPCDAAGKDPNSYLGYLAPE